MVLAPARRAPAARASARLPACAAPTMGGVTAADPRDRPIAVFDSGVGGLTVLHECLVSLPQEDFVYLGDTAMFPYGDKDPEQLRERIRRIAEMLLDRGAKLLVIAYNTATSVGDEVTRE